MKRELDCELSNSLTFSPSSSAAYPILPETTWTSLEDEVLMELVGKTEHVKWKSVSKQLNCQFSHAKRTTKECRSRWKLIQAEAAEEKLWDSNEEISLLYALYHTEDLESYSLRTKNIDQIRKHLRAIGRRLIKQIRGVKEWNVDKTTPIDVFKVFFYSSVLLRCMTKESSKLQ